MGELSKRTLLVILVIVAFVHLGTPWLADVFFELYHLTGVDALYSIYGALRYATAQFMFWENRWLVTLLSAILLFGLAWLWSRWRSARARPS